MIDISVIESQSIPEPNSGCWIWVGTVGHAGYGVVGRAASGGPVYAHRVACEAAHGRIPHGMYACHHCDNAGCVNPDHLYIGSPRENISDAYRRGRRARTNAGTFPDGESHINAKLTVDDVRHIKQSSLGVAELGRMFGVSASAICDVRAGRTWRHVDG